MAGPLGSTGGAVMRGVGGDGPRINSRDVRRLIAGFEQDKETRWGQPFPSPLLISSSMAIACGGASRKGSLSGD